MLFFYNYLYNPVKNRQMQTSNSNYKKKEPFFFPTTRREKETFVPSTGVLKKLHITKYKAHLSLPYHPSHARIPVVNTC